jgi:hypothetical protein
VNAIQKRYLMAQAKLDVIREECERLAPPRPGRGDNAIEAYFTIVGMIEDELGYYDAYIEMLNARRALLDWGEGVAIRAARAKGTPQDAEKIRELFARGRNMPGIEEQLITEFVLRVDA